VRRQLGTQAGRKGRLSEVAWRSVTGKASTAEQVGFSSVAGRQPWRVITASSRVSRSGRLRSSRSLAGDHQGVLLRPDRREGAGSQAPVPGHMPRERCVHPAAGREGGRLRLFQGVPSGRDRALVDSRARARGHAVLEHPLRAGAVVVRLLAHARARRRGGESLERLNKGDRPSASVVNSGVRPAELRPNINRELTRF
jgi:hypothetical protein